MKLKHKVALITGAASGMGAQTARVLADCGLKVAVLDQNLKAAQQVAKEIKGLALEADVSDEQAVSEALEQVIKEFGAVHAGVNCAGILSVGKVVSSRGVLPLDTFEKVIGVNLIGTFNVMRLLAEKMSEQAVINEDGERGVIINTASIAAFEGQMGQCAYSASKGGVAAMTLPAARDLAAYGIRVVAIAPGMIATPMVSGLKEKVKAGLEQAVTFPKRLGQPDEFAQLVKQVIENSYINATVLRLDGGLRMAAK